MATCAATHAIPKEWISRLDPEWVSLWNEHGCHQLRADEVSVTQYRRDPKAYSFTYAAWEGPKVFHEEELDVPVTKPSGTVRVRVYTPEGQGPFPVHFNYHGGGWVLGGLESEAAWCRSICKNVGIKVIDVDYRMAPEYLFPTAIYDSWEVVQWVRQPNAGLKGGKSSLLILRMQARQSAPRLNIKADSVSIGGLSAGGHMTAVMSHMAKAEGVDLKLALMVVPSTDLRFDMISLL
jgi:acetyl esterase/lipase